MVWMPVDKVPPERSGKDRPSKWDSVVERLREQPGQIIIIDHGLTKSQASSAVQALKKFTGITATSRTHDLPAGVDRIAVYAEFSEGDSL